MYDKGLAARLDDIIGGMLDMETTTMFDGYGFMMNGHICVGIWKNSLVIRIGVEAWNDIRDEPFVHPMDFTGKAMKGWAMVDPDGVSEDDALQRFVDMAIMFCATLPPKTGL